MAKEGHLKVKKVKEGHDSCDIGRYGAPNSRAHVSIEEVNPCLHAVTSRSERATLDLKFLMNLQSTDTHWQ